jgi:hypothetical protein
MFFLAASSLGKFEPELVQVAIKELKGSECEAEKIAKIECRDSSARFVVPSIWLQFAVVAGFLSLGHGLNARNQKARKFRPGTRASRHQTGL